MRELNECTAEVFRRGEQRIKERRRKRNRVLAVCIPVCLTAAIWSAMDLPARGPAAETSDNAQAVLEIDGVAPGSCVCPYAEVEIQAAGHCEEVADPAAVAEMFVAVNALFADVDGNAQAVGENNRTDENFPSEADNANLDLTGPTNHWKDYMITFTAENGSRAVYHLSGNTLADVSTNMTIFLNDSQLAGLMAVFGISE